MTKHNGATMPKLSFCIFTVLIFYCYIITAIILPLLWLYTLYVCNFIPFINDKNEINTISCQEIFMYAFSDFQLTNRMSLGGAFQDGSPNKNLNNNN